MAFGERNAVFGERNAKRMSLRTSPQTGVAISKVEGDCHVGLRPPRNDSTILFFSQRNQDLGGKAAVLAVGREDAAIFCYKALHPCKAKSVVSTLGGGE